MTIVNTAPYFITDTPTFADLEVQFNSVVSQVIQAADITDDENDAISLSLGFQTNAGDYIWAPSSLYTENPKYTMVF